MILFDKLQSLRLERGCFLKHSLRAIQRDFFVVYFLQQFAEQQRGFLDFN